MSTTHDRLESAHLAALLAVAETRRTLAAAKAEAAELAEALRLVAEALRLVEEARGVCPGLPLLAVLRALRPALREARESWDRADRLVALIRDRLDRERAEEERLRAEVNGSEPAAPASEVETGEPVPAP